MKLLASIVTLAFTGMAKAAKIPIVKNDLNNQQISAQIESLANKFLGGEKIDFENYKDWSYLVEVEIGTPPQKFMMGPDTVTTDSWVLGKNCWSLNCFWMPLYDSSKSSTYVADGAPFDKKMDDILGGGALGNISQDTFKVGDLVAENFKFGEVNTIFGNDLVLNKFGGVLGLAYNTVNQSISGLDPFLHQAYPSDKSFSLYLRRAPKESYMVVPGMDSDNFELIKEHKVHHKEFFQMKLDSIKRDDIVVQEDEMYVGIFNAYDSIVGFSDIMLPILDNLVVYKDCSNIDKLPDITFIIEGVDYTLTGEDYVINNKGSCVNGVT